MIPMPNTSNLKIMEEAMQTLRFGSRFVFLFVGLRVEGLGFRVSPPPPPTLHRKVRGSSLKGSG